MAKSELPAWAGSVETLSRRVKPIMHMIDLNKVVSPTQIDDLVRPSGSQKDYSAKYITFLRLLGYDFSVQKDGRKIISYTCIVVPDNVDDIINVAPKAAKEKVSKPKAEKTISKPKTVKEIKSRNLAAMKSVAAKRPRDKNVDAKKNSTDDGTSFAVDGEWDSYENLDLKTLT